MFHLPSLVLYIIVKLLVSMAGSAAARNALHAIDVDDAAAKRLIERKISEPTASKPAKETTEKKALRKPQALKEPYG